MRQWLMGTALVLVCVATVAPAATRVWNGGTGTWTDTNGVPWSNTSAPTTNDIVNLTQNTAGNITIDFAGNNPVFLTGDPITIGTRYGTLTVGNAGGGTTTLQIASGVLPTSNDGYINAGGRLAISGGTLSPMTQVNFNNAIVDQTGGWFKPYYYDFNLNGSSIYNCSGGTADCRQLIVSGTSVFNLYPGGTLNLTGNHYTYLQNSGVINQNGGAMTPDYGTLWLQGGTYNWNAGTYLFGNFYQTGGTFNLTGGTSRVIWEIEVGKSTGQTGVFNYAGGSMGSNSRGLRLGSEGGTGTFYQHGNLPVTWSDNNGVTGWLLIGGTNGSGTYYLGDTNGSSTIGALVGLGLRVGLTGVLRGRGVVAAAYYGNHQVSGKVIADGYGAQTNLDLRELGNFFAGYPVLSNDVENTSDKGWYAVNKCKLFFPLAGSVRDGGATYVKAANGSIYNVGESGYAADPNIDLVNSAQISFTGLGAGSGVLTSALLATNRTDIAASFQAYKAPLSVHEFSLAGNTFTSYTLTIRYDHTAIPPKSDGEGSIKIWQASGGTWVNVTAALDTTAKTVRTTALTTFSQFLVTVDTPPPVAGVLMMLR